MTQKEKPQVIIERIKVEGKQLVDKVRDIIEEGNARRVILKKDGRTLMEFPLSVGVGGAAAALFISPVLAAIGAIAALVSDIDVIIEREAAPPAQLPDEGAAGQEPTDTSTTSA
ncbi:DUF4342 domain-containing protein [Rhodocaloribacter litoris]|uniref:DUF4342 domain-containing protein n=1 Tax=Rhodocaloribacter litoris TaxID=2558931 RepID=UPI0014213942|nr:DUF4342 domain-containing protein [Rhodocaloribacter litoris]QXD15230.1 DUF4342 domain-containing protein [Rhodocaloribacter litoris]